MWRVAELKKVLAAYEMAILRRTERAMVRAMCGAELMERRRTEDLMEMRV